MRAGPAEGSSTAGLRRRGFLGAAGAVALAAAAPKALAQAFEGCPRAAGEGDDTLDVDALIPPGEIAGTAEADSAALRRAFQRASGTVRLAPRVYLLDAAALAGVALSGKRLLGHPGRTVLRQSAVPARDMISAVGSRDFVIDGVTFDGGGLLTMVDRTATTYPLFQPCLLIQGGFNFTITRCTFVGFHTCGILANNTQRGLIEGCRLDRGAPMSAPANYGIAVLGGGSNMTVRGNALRGCQIALDGSDSAVEGNDVSGWGFSAGINVAEDAISHDITIRDNFCHDSGRAPDRDGYLMEGIECWALRAIVTGNHCFRNLGNGLSVSGRDSVASSNICYDNGTAEHAAHGIYQRADATDGGGSLIADNRCFDTRASGQTQLWGYGQNGRAMKGIRLAGNDMDGCPAGAVDTSVWSPDTVVDGWRTLAFTPIGVRVTFAAASALVRVGPAQTIMDLDITMPATRERTAFGIDSMDQLPTAARPIRAVAFSIDQAPITDLRLMLDVGKNRIIANYSGGPVLNAALSGARIVATATWVHA
ncbi:right-handed parallel beta-helix repeat-containing protein [Lichenibacterium dinghuense]|uniref:right-handed parallel beta-helix repeat-containing protein n=1 Tax=Lichenibacterium dinghuense TaxID=2895977 RepID=UPI001F2DE481|nr:right-handed parallel beta-helix repeat-containing protein [Lichenibacterium sp. 6Y81]